MKKFNLLVLAVICTLFTQAQTVATFENLSLAPESYWNGSDLSGGFANGNGYFINSYDTAYFSWSGFGYSNVTDDTTTGWSNQYGNITGTGYNGSANYVVANGYGDMKIQLTGNAAGGTYLKGTYINNSTYAYYSMRDGDQFAKKFGGVSGDDADWFMLTVTGWLNGQAKNDTVNFMLADYTFADNSQDYILNEWTWLDLQVLGNVDSLQFSLSSSDAGQWGMNTPAYFVLDNFTTADVANVAPIASNDAASTNYNTAVTINILANDFDTTATPLSVTTTGGLIAGSTVTVDENNNLVYTPAVGIVAVDTVNYTVCDGEGLCASARVTVTVTGITGVENIIEASVNVYPNPFSHLLTIASTETLNEVSLFDLNGRMMEVTVNLNDNTANINTIDIAAGTYVVKMTTANCTTYSKVSKQ
ncbi:MAG: DUF4465 domain-containing protein [Bacteroidetes bacterium]|nr:DUF4465 domain-containing protein [Bacteroidota bacterium]